MVSWKICFHLLQYRFFQIFHDVAYKARNSDDLLDGIDEFLDQVSQCIIQYFLNFQIIKYYHQQYGIALTLFQFKLIRLFMQLSFFR